MKAAKHSLADASPRAFTDAGVADAGFAEHAGSEASFEAARATIGGSNRLEPVPVTRRLLVFLVLLAALCGVCALTWSIAWQRGLDDLRQNAATRVDRTTAELKSTLDRYEYLPYLLSRHPFVQEVLADPNPRYAARADRYLEDLNTHARATATYIIQANGRCVAASNWNGPDSFVGAEYLFRPYFVDALNGGTGRFFGLGTISREPGYFISQPVFREGPSAGAAREIIGVAVVKLNLEWLQGADATEPLLVTDDHGVIFLSSVPEWKYHTLRPLPKDVEASVYSARQYAQHPVTPLPMTIVRTLEGGAQIVRVGGGRDAPSYLATQRALGEPDWHLMTMVSLAPAVDAARSATIVTALLYISLCSVAFYWRMRRARVREMIRSRALLQTAYAELNERVAERTADLSQANALLTKEVSERTRAEQDLRAAHDELIQASKLAALGQMAAGITHELNQPLAALRSFSDNTRVFIERGDHVAANENLEAIAALTERMGKITNQLKLFVAKARPKNARTDVRRALRNVLAMLQPRLKHVKVALSADDQPPLHVRCEDLRLEQILINLIGNALDAVQSCDVPRIEIELLTHETMVEIVVRDNGPGIAADILPRLFEPFFTTKEMGHGLGLGLAISSAIARDYGGTLVARNVARQIEVDGPEGGTQADADRSQGAEFVITLLRA
ncbi:C4-dicarboxylate transport sensor protein [Caballeronia sordidicola]|uniref:C4-dicarboxylate transport sensor protein DctB n=1 Tax=Caballeronia sordidicola TaxID=196367 RepID=A0A158F6J0_CABSO|nr:ATP-binding protein [Caballeronia sordidicola]SAL15325.1 C4-dicarboxylate transport sensor protein [Caballeronia sordidicola]